MEGFQQGYKQWVLCVSCLHSLQMVVFIVFLLFLLRHYIRCEKPGAHVFSLLTCRPISGFELQTGNISQMTRLLHLTQWWDTWVIFPGGVRHMLCMWEEERKGIFDDQRDRGQSEFMLTKYSVSSRTFPSPLQSHSATWPVQTHGRQLQVKCVICGLRQ